MYAFWKHITLLEFYYINIMFVQNIINSFVLKKKKGKLWMELKEKNIILNILIKSIIKLLNLNKFFNFL